MAAEGLAGSGASWGTMAMQYLIRGTAILMIEVSRMEEDVGVRNVSVRELTSRTLAETFSRKESRGEREGGGVCGNGLGRHGRDL